MEAIAMRWKEYEDRLRAEGVAVGLLAARKFGAATAEKLAAACRPGNGARIAEVVDAIYECENAADLLARIERMA